MLAEMRKLAAAQVAGTFAEKAWYFTLAGAAFVMFAVSVAGVLCSAIVDHVTETQLQVLDEMAYPTIWYCANAFKLEAVQQDYPCDTASRAFFTWIDKYDETARSWAGRCLDTVNDTAASPFLAKLTRLVASESSMNPPYCEMVNLDGKASASASQLSDIEIRWFFPKEKWAPGTDFTVWMGFLDPLASLDEQVANYYYYHVNLLNTRNGFTFSVDKYVDKKGLGILRYLSGSEKGAKVTYKYNVQKASTPFVYAPESSTNVSRLQGGVKVEPRGFLTRTVTTRKKHFSEVWAELGGAWGSALLLLSAFFVTKSVPGRTPLDAAEPVKVFRLRGLDSRRALAREVAAMLQETHAGAEEAVAECAAEAAKEAPAAAA